MDWSAATGAGEPAFFDANVRLGALPGGEASAAVTAESLLLAMDRAGVGRALVRHAAQSSASPGDGNNLLARETRVQPRLCAGYAALPPHTLETGDAGSLAGRMADMGARALFFFPHAHRFVPDALSLGPLLEAACERRIPVFLRCGGEERDYPAVYRLLRDFPRLVCVLHGFGDWGEERSLLPLLDAYPGVHVETSLACVQDGALEYLADRVGHSRLLFGSGFPERSMFQARFSLLHADLTEDQKQAVASGNLERLLGEVALP